MAPVGGLDGSQNCNMTDPTSTQNPNFPYLNGNYFLSCSARGRDIHHRLQKSTGAGLHCQSGKFMVVFKKDSE